MVNNFFFFDGLLYLLGHSSLKFLVFFYLSQLSTLCLLLLFYSVMNDSLDIVFVLLGVLVLLELKVTQGFGFVTLVSDQS